MSAKKEDLVRFAFEKFKVVCLSDNQELLYYNSNNGIYENADSMLQTRLGSEFDTGSMISNNVYTDSIKIIKRHSQTNRESFFSNNKDLVCLKNGVFNLITKEFSEFDPKFHFQTQLPIMYDPNADCPTIRKFIEEIACKDQNTIDSLFEIVGWCLDYHKYSFNKMAAFYGSGRNGKTTFNNLLLAFLGKCNCSNMELQYLTENRFGTAQLYNKVANIASDMSSRSFKNPTLLKALTGGDRIWAEHKCQEGFFFDNCAKMIFSCNQLPDPGDDNTVAFWERWVIIDFKAYFPIGGAATDANMIDKLTIESELSGLFNLAVAALDRLRSKGNFSCALKPEETKERYYERSSPFFKFVEECLDQGDTDSIITNTQMYEVFKDFCVKHDLMDCGQHKFTTDFKDFINKNFVWMRTGYWKDADGNAVRCYRNVKLSENAMV